MNTNPETTELREVVQRTVEMVEQNARDNAYLRGAFEQMNQRFDDSAESINQRFDQVDKRIDDLIQLFNYRFEQMDKRFEQIDKRIDDLTQSVNHRFEQMERRFEAIDRRFEAVERRISSVEGQFSTQLRWIIGLMAPMYLALIALIIKVFLGS